MKETIILYDTLDYFDLVLNDYGDLIIFREHQNIDLLIISEKNKVVMAIENKNGANESSHQLAKYQSYVDHYYRVYTKIHVFLTPEREEASNLNWYLLLLYYYVISESLGRLINNEELIPE